LHAHSDALHVAVARRERSRATKDPIHARRGGIRNSSPKKSRLKATPTEYRAGRRIREIANTILKIEGRGSSGLSAQSSDIERLKIRTLKSLIHTEFGTKIKHSD
jgi:hypothetical protein